MYNISCRMNKNFLRYSIFFHRGPTRSPPALRFSKKPSLGRVKTFTHHLERVAVLTGWHVSKNLKITVTYYL